MENKRLATVEMKEFQEQPLFNAGLFKKDIDELSSQKYINMYLASEKESPEKLFLIKRPEKGLTPTENHTHNVYAAVSIYGDKISSLTENNGYYNVAIAPNKDNKNELVVFQSTGTGDEKKTVYVGNGLAHSPKSLGIGFVNDQKNKDYAFLNCNLDKVKLALIPDNEYKNIVIGIKDGGEAKNGSKMAILYPTTTADKDALHIIEIEKGKALKLPMDEKGNVRITVTSKNEANIKSDKANLNVYQSQSEADRDKDKNYIGKGWDRTVTEKKISNDLAM